MNVKEMDLTGDPASQFVYVKRDILVRKLDTMINQILIPEREVLEQRITKEIKNKYSAVKLLLALQRPKFEQSAQSIFIGECLAKVRAIEEEIENLRVIRDNLVAGEYGVKITVDQAKRYGV